MCKFESSLVSCCRLRRSHKMQNHDYFSAPEEPHKVFLEIRTYREIYRSTTIARFLHDWIQQRSKSGQEREKLQKANAQLRNHDHSNSREESRQFAIEKRLFFQGGGGLQYVPYCYQRHGIKTFFAYVAKIKNMQLFINCFLCFLSFSMPSRHTLGASTK